MDGGDASAEESATDSAVDDDSVGATLGRYVVIEQIGSGGMGRVMRGYDPRLHREVALKQLHPGILPGAAQAQLLLEARTMAKLNHPNIVAIYDVFFEQDTTILVMAYVRGQTLAEWLQNGRSSSRSTRPHRPEAIVEMFLAAARGLAAAHVGGILHRDFKPTNVLIEGSGQPKVTDFGLARVGGLAGSLAANVEDDDITTLQEAVDDSSQQRMGTPAYMAPEQHMDGPLDERTDQYAFCVALWEALTGHLPFPSTGDTERMAHAKFDGPPRWPASIKVDVAIVEALRRGMSPHPYDRWPSIEALCNALRAGLGRRRPARAKVLGALGLGLLGVAGVGWANWSGRSACHSGEERIARSWNEHQAAAVRASFQATEVAYAQRIEPALQAYAEHWAQIHAEVCESSDVRNGQVAMAVDPRMSCLADALVSFDATLDRLREADDRVAKRALDLVGRLPPLDRCNDERAGEGLLVRDEDAPSSVLERFHRELAQVRTMWFVGRYDDAAAVLADLRNASAELDNPIVAVELGLLEGQILARQGRYAEAEDQLQRAFSLALDGADWRGALSAAQALIKCVGYDRNRPQEGLAWGRIAVGLQERASTSMALAASDTANNVGLVYLKAGQPERAELEHRRALEQRMAQLGSDHIRVADSHNNIAMALYDQGRYAEAEDEHRLALALRQRALGPDHPDVGASHNNLAMTLRAREQLKEAELEYLRAEEVWARSLGREHPYVVDLKNNLGNLYNRQGRNYEAELAHREGAALAERVHGPRSYPFGRALLGSTVVLVELERYEEAEQQLRQVLAIYLEVFGPDHPELASVHHNFGDLYAQQQRYADAESEFHRSLAIMEATLGPDHPRTAFPLCGLGEVELNRGRPREALPFVVRCHAVRVETRAAPPLLNRAVFASADVFVALGQVRRARALVEATLTTLEAMGPNAEAERQALLDWLERHV